MPNYPTLRTNNPTRGTTYPIRPCQVDHVRGFESLDARDGWRQGGCATRSHAGDWDRHPVNQVEWGVGRVVSHARLDSGADSHVRLDSGADSHGNSYSRAESNAGDINGAGRWLGVWAGAVGFRSCAGRHAHQSEIPRHGTPAGRNPTVLVNSRAKSHARQGGIPRCGMTPAVYLEVEGVLQLRRQAGRQASIVPPG